MNKIKGEILNYRIFLKVSFVRVFRSPFRAAKSRDSAKWAKIAHGLAWNKWRVRITLNMILIWYASNQRAFQWWWHTRQVSLPGGIVWRAECSCAELLTVPMSPHGFSVSPAQTQTSLWQQFIPSDLIIDWGKGRSCYFLMGKCPNSVCFIKKIA